MQAVSARVGRPLPGLSSMGREGFEPGPFGIKSPPLDWPCRAGAHSAQEVAAGAATPVTIGGDEEARCVGGRSWTVRDASLAVRWACSASACRLRCSGAGFGRTRGRRAGSSGRSSPQRCSRSEPFRRTSSTSGSSAPRAGRARPRHRVRDRGARLAAGAVRRRLRPDQLDVPGRSDEPQRQPLPRPERDVAVGRVAVEDRTLEPLRFRPARGRLCVRDSRRLPVPGQRLVRQAWRASRAPRAASGSGASGGSRECSCAPFAPRFRARPRSPSPASPSQRARGRPTTTALRRT